ncbi:MAG: hypothetical protein COA78_25560 [Blastopirellula sp.]|nr:MAG: hypothetical protein COA78_25560 [Blastopirellula sp.]
MKYLICLLTIITIASSVACVDQAESIDSSTDQIDVQSASQLTINLDKAPKTYTNFSRVTGTPEELVIDFGLNTSVAGPSQPAIDIDQRIIMNYYTAKRLAAALEMSLKRHEQTFGEIETDIQKRVLQNQ